MYTPTFYDLTQIFYQKTFYISMTLDKTILSETLER